MGMKSTAIDQNDLHVIRSQPLFAGLPPVMFDRMLQRSSQCSFPKGRILFQRGDPADHYFIVLDGWVKIFRDTPDGDQAVLGIFSRGNMFAEAAAFLSAGYPASAEVVDDCRLLLLDARTFKSVVQDTPETALNMLSSMSRHLHYLMYEVECLKTQTACERLVAFLLHRCDRFSGPAVVELPYDKNLVAARLGVQPESLSRLLNQLREHGVTSDQGRVTIADVARLREFCPQLDTSERRGAVA